LTKRLGMCVLIEGMLQGVAPSMKDPLVLWLIWTVPVLAQSVSGTGEKQLGDLAQLASVRIDWSR